MSKIIIGYSIGSFLFLFIWSPWILPDSWTYVHKECPTIYVPLWNAWAYSALFILFALALVGIETIVQFVNSKVADHE